ncbi:transposon-encoded TnpW family protein [Dorea formicigenerans]
MLAETARLQRKSDRRSIFVVRYHFNEDAKETLQEKIN